eukprot:maker-scaffold1823_size43701-snap-gene-0.5 protein:Tk12651 transcript:maker-scaffold1823_size43701-snap-gene-0.5-mRNA-1 annotation:"ZYRO0C05236p"
MDGNKFLSDFDRNSVDAQCQDKNIWAHPPPWDKCVDTVTCSGPFPAPEGGTAQVKHSGSRYGPVCYDLLTSPSCHFINITKTSDSDGVAKFDVTVQAQTQRIMGLFLTLQLSAQVNSIQLADAVEVGTNSSNVFGLHKEMNQDPTSTAVYELEVSYHSKHSSICLEGFGCHQCDKKESCEQHKEVVFLPNLRG